MRGAAPGSGKVGPASRMRSRRLPGSTRLPARQLDRRDIGADRTHAVGFRALQQHRRCRRRHHRGRREIGRPLVVDGAIDHRAVAETVGGDDHGAVDLAFLLFVRGGHAATCAFRNSRASRQGLECATTSPITSSAGPSPAAAASLGRSSSRPTAAREVGARAARQHGRRRRRIAPGLGESVADGSRRREAHIDHHGRLLAGETGPVDRRGLVGAVRGDEGEPRRLVAEGERQFGFGGAAERRRDPGNDDDRNILLAQALDLFAAASEHEGIATLQANHLAAGFRGVDQTLVDLVLSDAALAAALADEHALGVAPHAVEHRVGDELVVEHDVGILQHLQGAQRQQIGIARAGADQEHGAGRTLRGTAVAIVDAAHEVGLGAHQAAGKHRRADRAVHDLLPELPRRLHGLGHAAAIAAHQRGEVADARGHDRLDALAQAPRQHRRMTAGADRHDHVAAIDDRREHEAGKVRTVDHVHRNAGLAGAGRNRLVARIAGRAYDRDGAVEIGGQGIVKVDLEMPGRGRGLHDLVGDVGVAGEPAHGRMGGQQEPQLVDRVLARADKRDGTDGDIHENR